MGTTVFPLSLSYIRSMERRNVWATEIEIFFAAFLLQTEILVWIEDRAEWQHHSPNYLTGSTTECLSRPKIYLTNPQRCHYEPVISVNCLPYNDQGSILEEKRATEFIKSPTKRKAVDDKLSSTIKKLRSWDNIINSSKAHIQEKLSRNIPTNEKVVSSNLVNTPKETKGKRFS